MAISRRRGHWILVPRPATASRSRDARRPSVHRVRPRCHVIQLAGLWLLILKMDPLVRRIGVRKRTLLRQRARVGNRSGSLKRLTSALTLNDEETTDDVSVLPGCSEAER